jgi:hypothetical protein
MQARAAALSHCGRLLLGSQADAPADPATAAAAAAVAAAAATTVNIHPLTQDEVLQCFFALRGVHAPGARSRPAAAASEATAALWNDLNKLAKWVQVPTGDCGEDVHEILDLTKEVDGGIVEDHAAYRPSASSAAAVKREAGCSG